MNPHRHFTIKKQYPDRTTTQMDKTRKVRPNV